jgi:hypothetical protein
MPTDLNPRDGYGCAIWSVIVIAFVTMAAIAWVITTIVKFINFG